MPVDTSSAKPVHIKYGIDLMAGGDLLSDTSFTVSFPNNLNSHLSAEDFLALADAFAAIVDGVVSDSLDLNGPGYHTELYRSIEAGLTSSVNL